MAFTRAWNEADPADSDLAKYGAQEIRELKVDVRERLDKEHIAASSDLTTDPTGMHQYVVATKTTTYTATFHDHIILCNGTFTLSLPTAATHTGKPYIIKNIGTGVVTIDPNGSETIDGVTTLVLTLQNESVYIVSDGTNWKVHSHPLPGGAENSALNCFRLIKSGANLTLERVTGTSININGLIYGISTLPTLAATGLTPTGTYYIYAYFDSGTGTVKLEASTTAFTVGTSGRAEKTGDTTRRLVGVAYCVTGPAWADSTTQRLVISYDHKKHIVGNNHFTADRSTGSTSWAEVNTEIRVEFITWADEIVEATITGPVSAAYDARMVGLAIGFDGTTASDYASEYYSTMGIKFGAVHAKKNLTVGYHYATLLGRVSANTSSYIGNSSAGEPRCGLSVVIRG